jgi:hypothetical protein
LFALSPIARANDTNDIRTKGESDGQYSAIDGTNAKEAVLVTAMRHILDDYAAGIGESSLGERKVDAVLVPIFPVFCIIPFESGLGHLWIVHDCQTISHIIVWLP